MKAERSLSMNESQTNIALTGVTGRVGSLVASHLSQGGVNVRYLVRTPARAPQNPGGEVVQATYFDTPENRQALAGVKTLFMVSAGESADRVDQHQQLITMAAETGVKHIVCLSFYEPAEDATFTFARDHYATEELIKQSGVKYTFLRDNFYQDVFPLFAVDGVILGPAEDGRVSAVAISDVAEVAAAVLKSPSAYENQVLNLTGPESLSMDEMAQIITEVTGTKTVFQNETLEEARASRAKYGAPDWEVAGWISTYTAIADGSLEKVSDDVQRVLGRPARSFKETLQA